MQPAGGGTRRHAQYRAYDAPHGHFDDVTGASVPPDGTYMGEGSDYRCPARRKPPAGNGRGLRRNSLAVCDVVARPSARFATLFVGFRAWKRQQRRNRRGLRGQQRRKTTGWWGKHALPTVRPPGQASDNFADQLRVVVTISSDEALSLHVDLGRKPSHFGSHQVGGPSADRRRDRHQTDDERIHQDRRGKTDTEELDGVLGVGMNAKTLNMIAAAMATARQGAGQTASYRQTLS